MMELSTLAATLLVTGLGDFCEGEGLLSPGSSLVDYEAFRTADLGLLMTPEMASGTFLMSPPNASSRASAGKSIGFMLL